MRKTVATLVAALSLLSACKPPSATTPRGKASVAVGAQQAKLTTRTVGEDGVALLLTGHVSLISDLGGGIISDNSGGIISDNSGGIISDNSGGVVSNNGGGMTGKAKRQLLATRSEALLANARIQVLDASGRVLVDGAGKPIGGRTDATGAFKLDVKVPKEGLVLQVPLSTGGALEALVLPTQAGRLGVEVTTASAIGARYVLDKFVGGKAELLGRLQNADVQTLSHTIQGGLKDLPPAPKYTAAELIALGEGLRARFPAVDKEFGRIQALILGQPRLGSGRSALEVPLAAPQAVLAAPDGTVLIADAGRLRRVLTDGTIETLVDGAFGIVKRNLPQIDALLAGPGGLVYIQAGDQLFRLTPENELTSVAGPGAPGAAGEVLLDTFTVAPDGAVYVVGREVGPAQVIVKLGEAGALEHFDTGLGRPGDEVYGIGAAADGSFDITTDLGGGVDRCVLYSWRPGQKPVKLRDDLMGKLWTTPRRLNDGRLVVVDREHSSLQVVPPSGPLETLVGPEAPAPANEYGVRGVIGLAADGSLYIADAFSNHIRVQAPDGSWKAIAGFAGLLQDGARSDIASNAPLGLAWDDAGRLLVAESGGARVMRFDGKVYEAVAGARRGYRGDGGPATAAGFSQVGCVLFQDGVTYVTDTLAGTVREIGPDGIIQTIAGMINVPGSPPPLEAGRDYKPLEVALGTVMGVALGSDGAIYWTSPSKHQVVRLAPDRKTCRLVAGTPGNNRFQALPVPPGTPATSLNIGMPVALAFDKQGYLYMSDTIQGVIYKITDPGGPAPTVESIAGVGPVTDGNAGDGVKAQEAFLSAPGGLIVDDTGVLYFTEAGTKNLGKLGLPGMDTAALVLQIGLTPTSGRVRRLGLDGLVTTIAGPGSNFFPDETAEGALVGPAAIALSADGRLAIADTPAGLIRILPAGSF